MTTTNNTLPLLTALTNPDGSVYSIAIHDGRSQRRYSAAQLLEALAIADRRMRAPVEPAGPRMGIEEIIERAAAAFRVAPKGIIGPSRERVFTPARFAVCYLARENGHTLDAIGACLGGRDHSTIRTAAERGGDLAATDAWFAGRVKEMEDR